MKKSLYALLIPLAALMLWSCTQSGEGGNKPKVENLPPARGEYGEIIMVMDSAHRKGKVGQALQEVFNETYPGLGREENYFDIKVVYPHKMNSLLRYAKNLVYVATMNNSSRQGSLMLRNYTKESQQRINQDTSLYIFTKDNEFARGQQVIHLFGKDEATLIKNLYAHKAAIQYHFHTLEKTRLKEELFKRQMKALQTELLDNYQFTMQLPYGYAMAKKQGPFVWVRQLDQEIDKNIFVYYTDYRSQDAFKHENVLAFRDKITKEFMRDVQNKDIYMERQEVIPALQKDVTFNGVYAVETRALWRLSNYQRGGPFVSYTFVDESLNRLYYVEAYVDSPGKDKRKTMNEFEVILDSFRTAATLQQTN